MANQKQEQLNHDLIETAKTIHTGIARVIISLGADKHTTDENGSTALHYAAANGYSAMAAMLLDEGANINATNNDGKTPLYTAIDFYEYYTLRPFRLYLPPSSHERRARFADTIYALAHAGATINTQNNQGARLSDEIRRLGHGYLIPLMRTAKTIGRLNQRPYPDLKATDQNGNTPLHSAIQAYIALPNMRYRLANDIYTLVSTGASLDLENNDHKSPRDLARESGHPALISIMEGARAAAGPKVGPPAVRQTKPDTSAYHPRR